MKKYLFLPILLIVISCTTFNRTTIGQVEIEKINNEITGTIGELKEVANLNKYEELEKFFLPTLKNKIIVNNIKQYDLSQLSFIFSEITPISTQKARNIMIINYNTESNYYILNWKKTEINGQWKISNVDQKK